MQVRPSAMTPIKSTSCHNNPSVKRTIENLKGIYVCGVQNIDRMSGGVSKEVRESGSTTTDIVHGNASRQLVN